MLDSNSRSLQWSILIQPPAKFLIQTDASRKGLGQPAVVYLKGLWSPQDMKYRINILELLVVKLELKAFTK